MSASVIGKIIANKKPTLRLPPKISDIKPATTGPLRQPISPANASKPKSGTPPLGIRLIATLKEPGQSIPQPIPQIAQPTREIIGIGENTITKYESTQMHDETKIPLSRLIFSDTLA